jgi:hypothetical protein
LSGGKAVIKNGPCASGASTDTPLTTSNNGVLYGSMQSMEGWGAGMEVSVRHEQDPYITASRLTDGCSSATNMGYPSYKLGFSDTAGTLLRIKRRETIFSLVSFFSSSDDHCFLLFSCNLIVFLFNSNDSTMLWYDGRRNSTTGYKFNAHWSTFVDLSLFCHLLFDEEIQQQQQQRWWGTIKHIPCKQQCQLKF